MINKEVILIGFSMLLTILHILIMVIIYSTKAIKIRRIKKKVEKERKARIKQEQFEADLRAEAALHGISVEKLREIKKI